MFQDPNNIEFVIFFIFPLGTLGSGAKGGGTLVPNLTFFLKVPQSYCVQWLKASRIAEGLFETFYFIFERFIKSTLTWSIFS